MLDARSVLALLSVLAGCETGARSGPPATTVAPGSTPAPPKAPPRAAPPPPAPPATLYLPSPDAAAAPALTAEPGPASSPSAGPRAKAPCRVALIGDSLTDFRPGGGGYVRYLMKRCPKSTFSNFAKGGAMVNQMLARQLDPSVINEAATPSTHLLVFGGVNDLYSDETAGRTPAKIEKDLSRLYAAGKTMGLRVVALTVAPWGGFTRYFNARRSAATSELNAWILAQPASGTVDSVVDAYSLLSCGDPERLCPRFEPPFRDGLHFGALGHEVLGQALYDAEFNGCS